MLSARVLFFLFAFQKERCFGLFLASTGIIVAEKTAIVNFILLRLTYFLSIPSMLTKYGCHPSFR